MNHKKIAVAIVLSLVILSTANAIYAADKEYSIVNAIIDLTVQDNGILSVNESYTYSFKGTFNGVYRDIPLKDGESIDDLKVSIDGAYGDYKVSDNNGEKRITVYLWADKEHTQKINDREVTVKYSYNMKNVVTKYNDIASLHYQLWGKNWDCNIEKLTANIHLPGNKDNTYYLNPEYYTMSDSIDGNTIHAETKNIPKKKFYELQVLMPLDDFKDATYAKHVNSDAKEQIMHKQAEYKGNVNFWGGVFNTLSILCLLSPLSLVVVYLKYGREPKVDYEGIYERELPTDDSPAVVNALLNRSQIGEPDMKGFEATIMDLIDRKILKMDIVEAEHTSDLILKFDNAELDGLSHSEKSAYSILERFSDNGILNVSRLSSKLNNEYNGKLFLSKFNEWKEIVEHEEIGESRLSKYFNNKGSNFSKGFSIFGIITSIILFIACVLSNHPASTTLLYVSVFLFILSIVILFIPNDIFGQWTSEGRVYYLKWRNFKKFLSDNSLIKEHPPESIVVWNKYLVYGTALGVADKVYESMKLHEPTVYDDGYYDLYRFHSYSGLIMLNSAFNTGVSAANPSSNGGGGIGDIGGGSGGGGGGAF